MGKLRPAAYQLVALSKLLSPSGGQLLITDGVGVGKTIAAGYCISWATSVQRENVIIVCPVSLVDKWVLELRGKFGMDAFAIRSRDELATARIETSVRPSPRAYVLPFSRVGMHLEIPAGLIVIDEIHNFRNSATRSWRELREMCQEIPWRVGLSATPINNKPDDLFAIFSLLYASFPPTVVASVFRFMWDSKQHATLSKLITRFEKETLGIHFARRNITQVPIQYPDDYVEFVTETVEALTGRASREGRFPLETITFFRAAASSPAAFESATGAKFGPMEDPKAQELARLVDSIAGQAIVFCQFKKTIDHVSAVIQARGRTIYALTGDVPGAERSQILDKFAQDENGVIFLTAVGAEGLDMQFADTVINYDMHWNPMVLEQRIGRIDRVGQTKPEIQVYNFHVLGSIDERVLQIVEKKISMIQHTPFQPAPVTHSGPSMFNDAAAGHESGEASQLAKSLASLKHLVSSDDRAVQAIDELFCDPQRLALSSPNAWLDAAGHEWLADVDQAMELVKSKLQEYEAVLT